MIRRNDEIETRPIERCHEGEGTVDVRIVLQRGDSVMGVSFMHDDTLPPGVTIGEHLHDDSEEVYFVAEGSGVIVMDGEESPIEAGEVSLVSKDHTHGIRNTGDTPMRLIVVGIKQR